NVSSLPVAEQGPSFLGRCHIGNKILASFLLDELFVNGDRLIVLRASLLPFSRAGEEAGQDRMSRPPGPSVFTATLQPGKPSQESQGRFACAQGAASIAHPGNRQRFGQ